MIHTVIVTFGPEQEFELHVDAGEVAGRTAEQARRWFDKEFLDLGCDLPNPVGKVLAADVVTCVARDSRAQRFQTDRAWAQEFARQAVALLGRALIRVDVAGGAIGF
jgi:hypothetical protein